MLSSWLAYQPKWNSWRNIENFTFKLNGLHDFERLNVHMSKNENREHNYTYIFMSKILEEIKTSQVVYSSWIPCEFNFTFGFILKDLIQNQDHEKLHNTMIMFIIQNFIYFLLGLIIETVSSCISNFLSIVLLSQIHF